MVSVEQCGGVLHGYVSCYCLCGCCGVYHGLYRCFGSYSIQLSPWGCTHLSLLIQSVSSFLSLFSIEFVVSPSCGVMVCRSWMVMLLMPWHGLFGLKCS